MRVLAIGTRMPQWVSDGADDYVKRLPREASIEWVELPASKRARDTAESRMLEEATAIERRLKPQEIMVVFDVEGKVISTETIAETPSDVAERWLQNRICHRRP